MQGGFFLQQHSRFRVLTLKWLLPRASLWALPSPEFLFYHNNLTKTGLFPCLGHLLSVLSSKKRASPGQGNLRLQPALATVQGAGQQRKGYRSQLQYPTLLRPLVWKSAGPIFTSPPRCASEMIYSLLQHKTYRLSWELPHFSYSLASHPEG